MAKFFLSQMPYKMFSIPGIFAVKTKSKSSCYIHRVTDTVGVVLPGLHHVYSGGEAVPGGSGSRRRRA